MIGHMNSNKIRVSILVCMLDFNFNVEYRLRYCNVTEKERVFDYLHKQKGQ